MGWARTVAGSLALLAACSFDTSGVSPGGPGGDGAPPGGDGGARDAEPAGDAGPLIAPGEARLVFSLEGHSTAHRFIYSSGAWDNDGITPPLARDVIWLSSELSAGDAEMLSAITTSGESAVFRLLERTPSGFLQQWSALRASPSAANNRFGDAAFLGTGGALAVYTEGTGALTYRSRAAGEPGWSQPTGLSILGLNGAPSWIEIAPRPGGDEAVLGVLTDAGELGAAVWTGSSWVSASVIDAAVGDDTYRYFDVAFEANARDALIAWGNGTPGTLLFATRPPGGSWSLPQTESSLLSAAAPDHVELTAEPGTDRVALVTAGSDSDAHELGTAIWAGDDWSDAGSRSGFRGGGAESFGIDVAWLADGAAVAAYASDQEASVGWVRWTEADGWTEATTTEIAGLGAIEAVRLAPVDGGDALLGLLLDSASSLFSVAYDGSDWSSVPPSPLEDVVAGDPVGPGTLPFGLAAHPAP